VDALMHFTVGTITQCAGGNHRHIPVTVGGVTRTLTVDRGDAAVEPAQVEEAIMTRLRSALKEAGAGTGLAAWNTALSGKGFDI
jgi:hypothetical protein